MSVEVSRRLRADAVRNAERILRAARAAYAQDGPGASLTEIAQRAGVGITTLYRRFPSKEGIARAALDQCIAEKIAPAIDRARADPDPRRGLTTLLEATMSLAAAEPNTLAAARSAGALTETISAPFFDALDEVTRRAQRAGQLRADVVPDDLRRIVVMLLSVFRTLPGHSDGWQRYVTLVLDGLSPVGASLLSPAVPVPAPSAHPVPPI
ncbi:MAG TPA: helix-turn-helix domain-containing protein [Pseudonocardiaceae bacterium]|jgi:AcrR family transcriptional regulator|nr:helix-turn-helix domain-containing protein [Pseudonocardiaceae bacterium]